MNLRRCLFVFLAGAGCGALAQGYPERLVRLIVPQAAGSATDTVARILAAELPSQLGQPVIVENKPGGALTIGLDITAKSAPDGYTIGMGPVGALAITRHMVAKLPYDIERDFQPIVLVTRGHLLLAVSPPLAVNSVQDLNEYVDKLNSSINRAIVSPMFKARFGEIGDEPADGTPEEFAEVIRRDSAKWAEVVKRSGAKID